MKVVRKRASPYLIHLGAYRVGRTSFDDLHLLDTAPPVWPTLVVVDDGPDRFEWRTNAPECHELKVRRRRSLRAHLQPCWEIDKRVGVRRERSVRRRSGHRNSLRRGNRVRINNDVHRLQPPGIVPDVATMNLAVPPDHK